MIVDPKNFIIELPDYHPLSQDYLNFWVEQKRRIIEGYWFGGYYMPPSLYFYVNLGFIEANDKFSNNKKIMRPSLHDLEWEFFRNWTEARGFSGFELDLEFSSNELLLTDYDDEYLKIANPSLFQPDGTRKRYITPYDNLRKQQPYAMGRALYENQAKNLMMLGSRDTGKSYSVGLGIILHQFLIDGVTIYNEETKRNPPRIEIAVGAETSARSSLLLNKVRLAMDLLPGSKTIGSKYYPSPISKQYKGSWSIGKDITAEYEKKLDGGWVSFGSRSTLKHRTFKDNPFAVQGGRELAIILEEAGLMSNLKEIYANTKDNLRNGMRKTGSLVMMGTGGDMEKGTQDAYEMFYSPDTYDILSFPNLWENTGRIAFFVPAYVALREFKDSYGMSKVEEAKEHLLRAREKAKNSKGGSYALNMEMQYRPIVPSEMFLTKSSNIFPVVELRRRISEIREANDALQTPVALYFDPESKYNGVSYKVDFDAVPIDDYPWSDDKPREGAVLIYEFPRMVDGKVPSGGYIIGCDPYKDDSATGESFASIYVMKTSKYPSVIGHDEVVASYVGRPYLGKNQVNEILYKLSLFYGDAKIYFENAVGNVKDYFEKIRRLDLLALQPNTVFNKKASYNTPASLIYGYPMSNQKVKWEAIQYVRQWLLTERGENMRNLDLICDKYLLQQLASFSMDGNFDAVMGLVGCIIGLEEIFNLSKRREESKAQLSQVEQDMLRIIVNNKRIFNEKLSQTKAFF